MRVEAPHGAGPLERYRWACRRFEAVLVECLVRQMRRSLLEGTRGEGSLLVSTAEQALADSLAGAWGIARLLMSKGVRPGADTSGVDAMSHVPRPERRP